MPSGSVVIITTQPPADFFRPSPRYADTKPPTGLEHTIKLTQHRHEVWNMLQHLATNYPVECMIREWQPCRVTPAKLNAALGIIGRHIIDSTLGRTQIFC